MAYELHLLEVGTRPHHFGLFGGRLALIRQAYPIAPGIPARAFDYVAGVGHWPQIHTLPWENYRM